MARTTISPPLTIVGTKNAAPACDSGVHIRNLGFSGHSHSASWIVVIVLVAWAVIMTPFGLPVVPPVKASPVTVSGANSAATKGCGEYFAASALRSTATSVSSEGTGPIVRICFSPGTFSSRPRARSTNIGLGSMISDVIPASFST